METTHAKPTQAHHHLPAEDGTETVTYKAGDETWDVTYATGTEASIESLLLMFPGTNREWLEKMHAPKDPRFTSYPLQRRASR